MECSDRALGVFLQIVEERSRNARLDAFENAEMHLQRFFNAVENAAHAGPVGASGKVLDVAVGRYIEIQLGPDVIYHSGELQC